MLAAVVKVKASAAATCSQKQAASCMPSIEQGGARASICEYRNIGIFSYSNLSGLAARASMRRKRACAHGRASAIASDCAARGRAWPHASSSCAAALRRYGAAARASSAVRSTTLSRLRHATCQVAQPVSLASRLRHRFSVEEWYVVRKSRSRSHGAVPRDRASWLVCKVCKARQRVACDLL